MFGSLFENKRGDPANAVARALSIGSGAMFSSYFSNQPVGNWDYSKAVSQGYERVISIFRCIDAIAQNAADRSLYVNQGSPKFGKGRRVVDEQLEYVLNTRANTYETAWQFRYRLSSQALLSRKGCFVEKVPNKRGRPAAFHLLDPTNVEPIKPTADDIRKGCNNIVTGYAVKQSDGQIVKMDPDQVIWFKLKPHPTDPYSQMTPLVAAGIVADTEYLSRIYNRALLANGGKAGQLILVDGDSDQDSLEELQRLVAGHGPGDAGRTVLIEGTGLDSVDLGSSIQDLQYLEGLKASKDDIYIAFGTPESVLGNASGRTFDNADAERLNWWMDTEAAHCNGIAACWDACTEGGLQDDLYVVTDYSDVDIMQHVKAQKEKDALNEVLQGGRTLDSYLMLCGREPMNTPASSVYWITAVGKLPVGAPDQVSQAITELQQIGAMAAGQGAMTGDQMSGYAQQGALQGYQEGHSRAQAALANDTAAQALRLVGKIVKQAMEIKTGEIHREIEAPQVVDPGPTVVDAEVVEETKTLDINGKQHPYLQLRNSLESEMFGTLSFWTAEQKAMVENRLNYKKVRQGTRHWEGEGAGTKALNVNNVVDIDRWAANLRASFEEPIHRTVETQFKRTMKELESSGVIDQLLQSGGGNSFGRTPEERVFGSAAAIAGTKSMLESRMQDVVEAAGKNQSRRLAEKISALDAEGKSIAEIKAQVARITGKRSAWQQQLSTYVTTALVEGTIDAALEPVGHLITKTWNTERDARVRAHHRAADGQTVMGYKSFTVGGHSMKAPGDPDAPIEETANCFPAGTFVTSGEVEVGYRRWYEGDLVEIVLVNGRKLSATPNHPVLTQRGWVAAGEVDEFDELFHHGVKIESTPSKNVNRVPTEISEVFDTLAMSGDLMRIRTSAVDFHGDGINGNVDVVFANGKLRHDGVTQADKFVSDFMFPSADVMSRVLFGASSQNKFGFRTLHTSDSIVGSFGESRSLSATSFAHPLVHRSATSTRFNSIIEQHGSERIPTDTSFDSKSLLGLSGLVTLNPVASIRRIPFSGHVFNLQTSTGAYAVDEIVAHNCRCWVTFTPNRYARQT